MTATNTASEWLAGHLAFTYGADTGIATNAAVQLGRTTTSALLIGGGTSSSTLVCSTSDKNFFGYWLTSSATSGTSRGEYIRLYLTGGAGGEAIRAYTTNSSNTPADTVNGAHISLSHGASAGNVTGEAQAVRATYHVPHRNLTGTNAAVKGELWADGTNSNSTGTTSAFRATLGGDATGIGKLDDTAFLLVLDGNTIGSGNIVSDVGNEPTWASATHKVRVKLGGTTMYLVAVLA